ncbi:hypothetical protein GGS23DRAFT_235536 [Durotheca rogersii]|uniref:uncharacterized protein n=1 Tax=Durotheca rogersii TaxID=419775 RepID=UPI0022211483|nr:uncharacterized protein GGS23DRAFT_235536 [Durotheca rogersii]KAI5860401.1 hypothetical protein GGS23DRAFT_235536 [Durotheca rogersii]
MTQPTILRSAGTARAMRVTGACSYTQHRYYLLAFEPELEPPASRLEGTPCSDSERRRLHVFPARKPSMHRREGHRPGNRKKGEGVVWGAPPRVGARERLSIPPLVPSPTLGPPRSIRPRPYTHTYLPAYTPAKGVKHACAAPPSYPQGSKQRPPARRTTNKGHGLHLQGATLGYLFVWASIDLSMCNADHRSRTGLASPSRSLFLFFSFSSLSLPPPPAGSSPNVGDSSTADVRNMACWQP